MAIKSDEIEIKLKQLTNSDFYLISLIELKIDEQILDDSDLELTQEKTLENLKICIRRDFLNEYLCNLPNYRKLLIIKRLSEIYENKGWAVLQNEETDYIKLILTPLPKTHIYWSK